MKRLLVDVQGSGGDRVPAVAGFEQLGAAGRHVSGQQLCEGLREFALLEWGMLARTVLARWNISRTVDFGRIVFALIDNGWMSATDEDDLDDFRDVYDFKSAFETKYRIEMKV